MQVAHEDLNDVDDPTKEIATKAKRKSQPRWLKSFNGWEKNQAHVNSFVQNLPSGLTPTKSTFDGISCASQHIVKNNFFICACMWVLFHTVG